MMGFTSRTATRTTVAALRAAGWGWIVGPLDQRGALVGDMPHCLDNGAWPAHVNNQPWDEEAFSRSLLLFAPGATFIVVPDIVAGGPESLALSMRWLPRLKAHPAAGGARLLIAVQDGMKPLDLAGVLNDRVGIFVGGSTEWKLTTLAMWGQVARSAGCYLHVGRVNSAKRIALCAAAGADSFDGRSPILFPKTLGLLDRARRQPDLFAGGVA